MTPSNKHLFSGKLLVGLRGQLFNSLTMYEFKINLLYSEEELFCTKTELLNFKITKALAKLDMVCSKSVSNALISLDDIPVDIQWKTFLFISNISELSIGAKLKIADNHCHL